MDNWNMSSGNWFGMTIFMVIGLLLIALVVMLVSRGSISGPGERGEDALTVLRHRFAAGEITEAEFRSRRETLGL